MKTVTITDFLTDDQIEAALQLYHEEGQESFALRCCEEIIEPNIEEINRKLEQENDPMFLAYACEHIFNVVQPRKPR